MNNVMMVIQLLAMDVVVLVSSNEPMVLSVEMVLSKQENNVMMVMSIMVMHVRVSVRILLLILDLFLLSLFSYSFQSEAPDITSIEKAKLLHKYLL